MADSIGRADYELGATLDKLREAIAEAEKTIAASGAKAEAEYADAGQKSGKAFGDAWAKGARVLAGAAAGVFAIATKGALELENVAADFRAETGATAEAAARAGKAINEMSGRNVQGIKEIGSALTKVHTDLGLTGEEAEQTTERFLRYARVTKQDAAAAVLAFDDVLDAWGLTAADAQGLMDKLIVSHQQYGGSIEANQDALARMAPALRALNATTDDGIALLNLFAASGLDASAAQRGLNSAVANMPPGTSLAAFVAELAAIEDPALRAARASEVFGTMAGPKLANALGNATDGLEAYAIGADEAAGATDRANEALESTASAWVMARLRSLGAAIRGLGAEFGPAITGAASLATGLAAIVGTETMSKLRTGLSDGLKGAWTRIASSAAVKGAVAAAGAAAGAVYAAASAAVEHMASALGGAWSKIASHPKVLAAAGAAGGAAGSAFAAASGAAAAVGGTFAAAGTAIAGALAASVGAALAAGVGMLAVALGISSLIKQASGMSDQEWKDEYERKLLNAYGGGLPSGVTAAVQAQGTQLRDAWWQEMDAAGMAGTDAAAEAGRKAGQTMTRNVQEWLRRGEIATITRNALEGMIDAVRTAKSDLLAAWRDALTERNRLANLKDEQLINQAERAAQRRILADKDATKAEKAQARIRLRELRNEHLMLLAEKSTYTDLSKKEARQLARAVEQGMKSKDPSIRQYWIDVQERTEAVLEATARAAETYGERTGRNYAKGLTAMQQKVADAAEDLANGVHNFIGVRSPAKKGPLSLMGGPEGYGARLVSLYARGMRHALADVTAASAAVAGAALLSGGSLASTTAPVAAGLLHGGSGGGQLAVGGTVRVEHTLSADAARALRTAGYDERGVATALADAGGLFTGLQQLRAMTSG